MVSGYIKTQNSPIDDALSGIDPIREGRGTVHARGVVECVPCLERGTQKGRSQA